MSLYYRRAEKPQPTLITPRLCRSQLASKLNSLPEYTWEYETTPAQHRRLPSASYARRAGTRERSSRYHRRTGNRGQTRLPVGLEVIGRVRVSQKPRPRLVQASISSLHHETFVYVSATLDGNVPEVNASPAVLRQVPERL